MEQEACLKVGRSGEITIFKVSGRGIFRNSLSLEKLALDALEKGNVNKIIIDLKECLYMDSTFMGALAGINSALLKKGKSKLIVANTDERNKLLLDNLGLSLLMEVRNDLGKIEVEWEPVVDKPVEIRTMAKHILAAHDYLGKTDPRNHRQFSDVKRLITQSLSREKPSDR